MMYKNDMGTLSETFLSELRSPDRALCDLIESHARMTFHDPRRFAVGQMIRQLATEVTYIHVYERTPASL